MNNGTLLIIPCCKSKILGGKAIPSGYQDPLSCVVSEKNYYDIKQTRKNLYSYVGNKEQFMPAVDRYIGNLYKSVPSLAQCIKEKTNSNTQPKLIILSALYGPLHPETLINDYELKMASTKKSPWNIHFPAFLENYVRKNKIQEIRIYCGLTTGYYYVLSNSIKPLLNQKLLSKAIHYHIHNGSSYHTPHNHGLQLSKDLMCSHDTEIFTRIVETKYL